MKHGQGGGGSMPTLRAKRKRDEDLLLARILACIPTVSESVARALSDQFATLGALQEALKNRSAFPSVRLANGRSIGKARIERLALALA